MLRFISLLIIVSASFALGLSPFPLWAATFNANTARGPFMGDSAVYVVPHDVEHASKSSPALAAFAKGTGETLFTKSKPSEVESFSRYKGFAAETASRVLYGVADGEKVWVCSTSGADEYNITLANDPAKKNTAVNAAAGAGLFFVAQRWGIVAINATTGNLLWNYTYINEGDIYLPTMAVHDNRVLVSAVNSYVVGIDIFTGGRLYQASGKNTGYTTTLSTISVSNGIIVANGIATTTSLTSNNGTMLAYDANTGEALWQYICPCILGTYPTTDGTYAVVNPTYGYGCDPRHLKVLDARTGAVQWELPTYWDVRPTTLWNGTLLAPIDKKMMDYTQNLYAFQASSGALLATISSHFGHFPSVVEGNVLYAVTAGEGSGSVSLVAIQL